MMRQFFFANVSICVVLTTKSGTSYAAHEIMVNPQRSKLVYRLYRVPKSLSRCQITLTRFSISMAMSIFHTYWRRAAAVSSFRDLHYDKEETQPFIKFRSWPWSSMELTVSLEVSILQLSPVNPWCQEGPVVAIRCMFLKLGPVVVLSSVAYLRL